RIAAHAADIVRIGDRALKWDYEISKARAKLDWRSQFKLAMDPEEAERIHNRVPSRSGACSVCGKYCVFLVLSRYLSSKG
ncbi:MAG: phosphomethylpyrimidine synthase, partial [Thermoprotei archaeon]